jgi:hypothetical protein
MPHPPLPARGPSYAGRWKYVSGTILNALRAALRIFSGKKIFKFRISGKSADFPETHFHGKGLGPDKFRRPRQTRIKNKISANYGQSERGGHLNLYPYKKRLPHAMHSSPFEKLFLRNAPP